MTQRETDALFILLRRGIGAGSDISAEQKEIIRESIPAIYKESKKHDLAHLAAAVLFDAKLISPEDDCFEEFKRIQIAAFYREARMTADLADIAKAFEEAEIPFIPLKGSVLRDLYPEKWIRTSGDIDVLVPRADLKKAISLLIEKKGYTYMSKYTHDISLLSKNNFHIEVHFELIEEGVASKSDKVLSNVWNYATKKQGYKYWYEMPDEVFYLYHMAHAAKHLLNGGCGIKVFLDLWMLENKKSFDLCKRNELLEKTELIKFANVARELSRIWFDGAPIEKEEQVWLQNFVLGGGVYGTSTNHMIAQHQKRGGKLGYAVRLFFPSYNFMCRYFPILEDHKWLTPFMYPVRWLSSIFRGNTKRVARVLKSNQQTPKEVDETMRDLIDRLGL